MYLSDTSQFIDQLISARALHIYYTSPGSRAAEGRASKQSGKQRKRWPCGRVP